jgi:hypothetical protein
MITSLRTRLLWALGVLIVVSCVGTGSKTAICCECAIRNHALTDFTPQPSIDTESRVVIRKIPDRSAATENSGSFPSVTTDMLSAQKAV